MVSLSGPVIREGVAPDSPIGGAFVVALPDRRRIRHRRRCRLAYRLFACRLIRPSGGRHSEAVLGVRVLTSINTSAPASPLLATAMSGGVSIWGCFHSVGSKCGACVISCCLSLSAYFCTQFVCGSNTCAAF